MKYKTFEELKEELGDKFEEYMYKANIELLTEKYKAIEYIEEHETDHIYCGRSLVYADDLLKILKGNNNEL